MVSRSSRFVCRSASKGKQGGARLIYYRDEERVVALFLYSKGDVTDIPVKEIREALAPYP